MQRITLRNKRRLFPNSEWVDYRMQDERQGPVYPDAECPALIRASERKITEEILDRIMAWYLAAPNRLVLYCESSQ